MPQSKRKYKVRNRNRHVELDVPEEKIVSRIERGKYVGEEEVARLPDGDWKKLSAEPVFYDALMRRLFSTNYKGVTSATQAPVEKEDEKSPSEEGGEKEGAPDATHQASIRKVEADPPQKATPETKRLVGEFEGTIDQALLKELFDEKTGKEEATGSLGETVVKAPDPMQQPLVEAPKYFNKLKLPAQLDIFRPKEGEEGHTRILNRKSRFRRRMIMGGGIVLALLFLFWDADPPAPNVDATLSKESFSYFGSDPEKNKETVTSLINEGKQLYSLDNFGYYQRAAELFIQAHQLDKTDAQANALYTQSIARVLPVIGQKKFPYFPQPSTEKYERSLAEGRSLDPQNSGFFRAETLRLLEKNDLEGARDKISDAIDTDPLGPDNAVVLGEVSYTLKDFKIAKEALSKAVDDPLTRVRARYYLARIAVDMDNFPEASKHLKVLLELNPLHFEGFLLAGDLAAKQNKYQEALKQYKQTVRLSRFAFPNRASIAHLRLGRLYGILGQKSEAEDNFLLAYYFNPESADAKELTKGLDTSEVALKALFDRKILSKEQLVIRGETYFGDQDFENAFRYIQAAYVLDPRDASVLVRLGDIVEKKAVFYHDFIRVKSFYERAILQNPSYFQAYVKLGMLETEHYNFEKGHQLLSQAKALAPQNRDALVAMGKHSYLRQDYNHALDDFIEASNINEQDSEILYYAGKMRVLFSKDPKAAMILFERSYKNDPQNYLALAEWLKLKVITFDKPFAIKFINNLIDGDPKNAKFHWIRGEVHAANQDQETAIENYYKSLDLDNRDSVVRMSLARAHDEIGDKKKAVAEYTLASRLDRRNAEGFSRAADLLIEMGNSNEAEEILNTLIEVSPKYPGAQRALSQVYEAKKKPEEAEKAMQAEVNNNPANAKFRTELAELLMKHEKYEPAIEQLTEITNLPSLAEAPEFVFDKIRSYLLLSRCYRELKQYDSAEGSIKLALAIDDNDPALLRELGYVYVGLQRNKDAATAFRGYLQRNPAAEDAEQIKNVIENLVIPE